MPIELIPFRILDLIVMNEFKVVFKITLIGGIRMEALDKDGARLLVERMPFLSLYNEAASKGDLGDEMRLIIGILPVDRPGNPLNRKG